MCSLNNFSHQNPTKTNHVNRLTVAEEVLVVLWKKESKLTCKPSTENLNICFMLGDARGHVRCYLTCSILLNNISSYWCEELGIELTTTSLVDNRSASAEHENTPVKLTLRYKYFSECTLLHTYVKGSEMSSSAVMSFPKSQSLSEHSMFSHHRRSQLVHRQSITNPITSHNTGCFRDLHFIQAQLLHWLPLQVSGEVQ